MIREERDPAFWGRIARHPAVMDSAPGFTPEIVERLVVHERMIPLAARNGGYLFSRADGLGRVLELHSMFTPEGWGREAHLAGIAALRHVFTDACAVITYEIASNARSRPPRSFGFTPLDDFRDSGAGMARTWMLTRTAWEQSPAFKRSEAR